MTLLPMFPFFVLLYATLTNSIDVIDNIWNDDFVSDSQGLNGWHIYYNDQEYDTIPFINGTLGKYHGIYEYHSVSTHYLKRTFQCKNDSSIRLGYMMAFCGNEITDKTQVHLNTGFAFLIDFISENRLYSFQDTSITSNITCGTGYRWYVYYNVASAKVLQSFIAGQLSFDIKIEVKLSANSDRAVINNITLFCDPPIPTAVPTSTPSVSTIAPTLSPTATPFAPTLSPTTKPMPTTSNPTTTAPTTFIPTTTRPTTSNPTTTAPTAIIPTTTRPTTSNPTTTVPTTIIPTTIMPTTFSPTTKNPTTIIPTTVIPTTVFPTTNNPTTTVPTTIIPTTITPTTSMPSAFTPTTAPMTTIPTSNSPTFISPTSLINSMDELGKESNIESMGNILMFIVIGIVTLLISFLICFVSYKIYTKKQRSNVDETECVSHVEMNIKLTKDENTIKNMNGKPVNEESKNSYEEMYDKAIMSLSTKGETLTEGAISTDIESRGNMSDNMLIKNEVNDENKNHILFKQNTTDMIDIHNTEIDDNDRSDTEKMFDTNTQNITTPGGMENELYTTNGPVIEGYIANKEEDNDNDDIYIQSNVQTTKGNDV